MKSKESMAPKKKSNIDIFTVLTAIFFVVVCTIIIIPLVKVFVDSIDAKAAYGMNLWPNEFSLSGYKLILSTVSLYLLFIILHATCTCRKQHLRIRINWFNIPL